MAALDGEALHLRATAVMPSGSSLMGFLLGDAGPVFSLLIATLGGLGLRRRPGWLVAVPALAVLGGWAVVAPAVRLALWPRGLVDHLVLPAVIVLGAALVGPRLGVWSRRWLWLGCAGFGAWWLAGSAAGRAEFWRVGFAVMAGSWVLHRLGGGQARRALVVGLMLAGSVLMVRGNDGLLGLALVLAGCAVGLLISRAEVVVAPVLLALALVAVDLGAGRLMRGGVGVVDLVCGAALVVPGLEGGVARGLARRAGRVGTALAPAVMAGVVLGLAWVVSRSLR